MNLFALSPDRRLASATVLAAAWILALGGLNPGTARAADGDTTAKPAATPAAPEIDKDIAKNPILKHLIGEWEARSTKSQTY